MTTRSIIYALFILVFATSCTAAEIDQYPLETATNTPPTISNPTAQPSVGTEGFYFIKQSPHTPFTYSMAYAPIQCKKDPKNCSAIEIIFDFPPEYTFAGIPLNWSPDGKRAVFFCWKGLLSYTPPEKEFKTLATDLSITNMVMPWSPDQKWVALSIQDTTDANHIMLFDPSTRDTRSLEPGKSSLLYITQVEWINDHELRVEIHDYGDPANQETKKFPVRKFISIVNINDNTWTEIEEIPLGATTP